MSFLNISGFALALLLPLVVIMYLLKLRREEHPVSSTYLWRRMVRDIQANAPWQRLQRNLLLILQLLFLIALIIAIARPASPSSRTTNQSLIIILDTSASMAATDAEPSRMQVAKHTASELVASLSSSARVTLIAAGMRPRTLVSLSTDRRSAHQTISQLQVESGGSDMASALQIAAAISQRQPDTLTVVLSDGNVELPRRVNLQGTFRYIPIGSSNQNQSIQRLSIRTEPVDQSLTAFAQVANHSAETISRRVGFLADGNLISTSVLTIPPGSEVSALASGIISNTNIIEARLLESEAHEDFLHIDDRAITVNRENEPIKITLVTEGNLFLETALGLMPSIQLHITSPGDPIDAAADLVIFDAMIPQNDQIPETNLFFIAPPESSDFFTITDKINLPSPKAVEPIDPLLRHVDLSGVSILDAMEIKAPDWLKPLIEDTGFANQSNSPLLLAGETTHGRRVAVLAFNLTHSDLPLQVAFPVLLANLIEWLAPGRAGLIPASISPGAPIRLAGLLADPARAEFGITIIRPDGGKEHIDPDIGDPVFSGTGQLGLYTIDTGGGNLIHFSVNLFSLQESQIAPIPSIQVTGIEQASGNETRFSAAHEWWRVVALLALALLTIEWFVYHRTTLLQLIQRIRTAQHNTGVFRR